MSEHVVEISRVARSLHSLLELPFQRDQDLVSPGGRFAGSSAP